MRLRVLKYVLPVASAAFLSACGSATPAGIQLENQTARAEQLMRIAHVTRQGGDLQTAATMYERAARHSPDSAAPLLDYAETLHGLAEFDQAAVAYQKAIKIDSASTRARVGYGRTLLALGRPALARDEFEIAAAANPPSAAAYNGLGVAQVGLGAFEAGLKAFDAGLALTQDDPGLQTNRALCLALAGHFEEAAAVLTRLAVVPGATPRQRLNAALVFGLMGKPEQAVRWARADLTPQAVAYNLEVYEELRTLAPEVRARRVLGLEEIDLLPTTPARRPAAPGENAQVL